MLANQTDYSDAIVPLSTCLSRSPGKMEFIEQLLLVKKLMAIESRNTFQRLRPEVFSSRDFGLRSFRRPEISGRNLLYLRPKTPNFPERSGGGGGKGRGRGGEGGG